MGPLRLSRAGGVFCRAGSCGVDPPEVRIARSAATTAEPPATKRVQHNSRDMGGAAGGKLAMTGRARSARSVICGTSPREPAPPGGRASGNDSYHVVAIWARGIPFPPTHPKGRVVVRMPVPGRRWHPGRRSDFKSSHSAVIWEGFRYVHIISGAPGGSARSADRPERSDDC